MLWLGAEGTCVMVSFAIVSASGGCGPLGSLAHPADRPNTARSATRRTLRQGRSVMAVPTPGMMATSPLITAQDDDNGRASMIPLPELHLCLRRGEIAHFTDLAWLETP